MQFVWKLTAGLIGGLCVVLTGYFAISIVLNPDGDQGMASILLLVLIALGLGLALTAPTPGKAWRRTMVASAVFSLCLPLSTLAFSARTAEGMGSGTAEATGAAIGGAMVFGAAGMVGFFLAAVFLVIGLVCGREPKIFYVQQRSGQRSGQRDYDQFQ